MRRDADSPSPATIAHLFSVDVEEYFHVNAFERFVPRERWDSYPSRVVPSVERLLELLARYDARGTFFTLGWVAVRKPQLLRAIAAAGHEVASHGFWHRRVPTLSEAEFRADVRDARAAIEDAIGSRVRGYRAPSFSIVPGVEWAFDVLLEEGFEYDSSRFPIHRPGYGSPGTPLVPHVIERTAGRLLEVPLATATYFGWRVPSAGGGYLRQLPLAVIRRGFCQATARGVPAMFYIHPWELDPQQPRLEVPPLTRLRHYRGLASTEERLERLLAEFRFTSVEERMSDSVFAGASNPPSSTALP